MVFIMKRIFVVLGLLLSMSACISNSKYLEHVDPAKGDSLVVVYVDMKQAPSLAEWGWIKAVNPIDGKVNFKVSHVKSDKYKTILFAQNIPPGKYYLEKIAGQTDSFSKKNFSYSLGSAKSPLVEFKVRKQGVYYLGSYKYNHIKSKFGKKTMDDFNFVANKKIKSKDVLRELATKIDNQHLRKMIKKSVRAKG